MSIPPVALRTLVYIASLLTAGVAAAAGSDTAGTEPSPTTPVAVIGKTPVTYADLQSAAIQQLAQKEAEYDTHRRQLQIQYDRSRHDILDAELEKLVNKRVLDLEAQASKTTSDALLAKLKAPAVTDGDIRQFYEEHKAQTQESFEKLQGRIKDHLLKERSKEVAASYYASLRTKYHAELTLEPLRAAVAADGPSRGPSTAAVTIVEFADFQCPFCRQMEPVLQQALKRYPDTLRLVYRNYPLTDIHPQAMQAAQAAGCAQKEGKFWEMHDALMSDGTDLSIPSLRATAARVGLDSKQFEDCVRGQQADGMIQDDMLEATALAVSGTPALFVNGRLIPGTVSLQTLSGLIDDELRRKTRKSSVASASLTQQR